MLDRSAELGLIGPSFSLSEFCCALTKEERQFLEARGFLLRLPANRIIFCQGEVRKNFYLVKDGAVRIFYISETGKKINFCTCSQFEMFGLADLNPPAIHSANAETTERSNIWRIGIEQLPAITSSIPHLTLRLIASMSLRLNTIASLMESVVTLPLRIRVAEFLLTTGIKGLSHESIADILGCSRQTLTKILNEFARAGFIQINRKKITILSSAGLRSLQSTL